MGHLPCHQGPSDSPSCSLAVHPGSLSQSNRAGLLHCLSAGFSARESHTAAEDVMRSLLGLASPPPSTPCQSPSLHTHRTPGLQCSSISLLRHNLYNMKLATQQPLAYSHTLATCLFSFQNISLTPQGSPPSSQGHHHPAPLPSITVAAAAWPPSSLDLPALPEGHTGLVCHS